MLFFSYSRGNLLVVRSVAAELRRLGYRTWLDLESLRPGERWREAIERAMAASHAMVYCISRLSLESNWTGVELRAARARGLTVVPLLVDDTAIESLPPELGELQLITTAGWARHELPARAAQAIAKSVGRPSQGVSSWSEPAAGSADAMQVDLCVSHDGKLTLAWACALWPSPPAPLTAAALCELARAADEARAAELHVTGAMAPAVVALVLGALAARLGPGRVRVHAEADMSQALGDVVAQVQAVACAPRDARCAAGHGVAGGSVTRSAEPATRPWRPHRP